MRIALAGTGAFGIKHLDGLAAIDGVTVTAVVSRRQEQADEVARKYGVPHAATDLDSVLARDDVDAVILCTPTQLHARQAVAALRAGKHVQVEIPVADSFADAREVQRVQQETGLTCMVGHTRRFNPSHQWVHRRIGAGELSLQQLDVQTYFFRRTNMNAAGQPRSWTDHLLWHHAAHTVDLFQYQAGEEVQTASAVQGPLHPELGIAMDMSVQLRTGSGTICTLSLSFNNDGPLGSFFRYICDNGTYLARYDDLVTGREEPVDVSKVDVSMNGIELQDREFTAAIREGREPNSSIASVLPCYRVLGDLERQLGAQRLPGGGRTHPVPPSDASPIAETAILSGARAVTEGPFGIIGWMPLNAIPLERRTGLPPVTVGDGPVAMRGCLWLAGPRAAETDQEPYSSSAPSLCRRAGRLPGNALPPASTALGRPGNGSSSC